MAHRGKRVGKEDKKSMSAQESKPIVRRFWDVWEQGNIDLVDEVLASNYVNHTPATPDQPTGPEEVKAVASSSGVPCPT